MKDANHMDQMSDDKEQDVTSNEQPNWTDDELQQLMFVTSTITSFYPELERRVLRDNNFFIAPPNNFSYKEN